MKISELKGDYKTLAEIRRDQSDWDYDDFLMQAFRWKFTPERHDFWYMVNDKRTPFIPSDSLKEIREYEDTLVKETNRN